MKLLFRVVYNVCNFLGGLMVAVCLSGCTIQLGIEVCTVPSERYNHGSVMHDDGTLYVYGGSSQRCADYCDDIWFFDIYLKVRYCKYVTASAVQHVEAAVNRA